jgi:hypothetical protein
VNGIIPLSSSWIPITPWHGFMSHSLYHFDINMQCLTLTKSQVPLTQSVPFAFFHLLKSPFKAWFPCFFYRTSKNPAIFLPWICLSSRNWELTSSSHTAWSDVLSCCFTDISLISYSDYKCHRSQIISASYSDHKAP